MGFRDYLVWRRGTVAPAELYVGLFDQVAETIDDLDRAAPDHARMAEVVTDDVYRMVPAASGADRSALLRLRRDVHNDRWPAAAGLRAAQRLLTGAAAEHLAAWLASWTARDKDWAQLTMPSGEIRRVSSKCRATIGTVSNAEHMNISMGKAGRMRWKGRKPHNRGTSMNPTDHPMGGGEGRTAGGRDPCSRRGVLAKGGKTRPKKKPSNSAIIRRRPAGPFQQAT